MHCALPLSPLSLSAAFAAGIAGSVHCIAMCGGIVGAMALRARSPAAARAALHQVGRVAGYTLLGALGGTAGRSFTHLSALAHASDMLRAVAAALLIALGLQLFLRKPLLRPLEQLGACVWRKVAPVSRFLINPRLGNALLMGLIWSLMPCGLVYSMLAVATLSASPLTGALMMLAFGAGTVPALLGGGYLVTRLRLRLWLGEAAPRAAGTLFVVFGLWTVYAALMH